ncbi:MAG: hypothetical protein ACFFAU_01240 [Candidatus Hodarchaeota archaeon]
MTYVEVIKDSLLLGVLLHELLHVNGLYEHNSIFYQKLIEV